MKSLLWLLLIVVNVAWGALPEEGPTIPEESATPVEVAKDPADAPTPALEMKPIPAPPAEKVERLNLHVRLDTNFSAGGPSQQGFSIPSVRLSAFGNAAEHVRYRLSMGSTREFSSVLLPQLMPVEAYIELTSLKNGDRPSGMILSGRMGMFTPTFNPWWSPDLSDLQQPDYFDVHRAAFINRDLGAEIKLTSYGTGLELSAGFFNGNGILALNTNNSKTVVGSGSYGFEVGKVTARLGVAGYTLLQSSVGSINYKSNWVGDVFFALASNSSNTNIQVDVFTGRFEDSTRLISPSGVTIGGQIEVSPVLQLFARWENITASPKGSNQVLTHFQAGPIATLGDNLRAFTYFDYIDLGEGGIENSVQLRLRLSL